MKKYLKENKKKLFFMLFCFLISFITLFFCSKNSPFYPYNNWVDEHAFFTVGKVWANGTIPYRDIFEQKGPLLYFIFMLASLIDSSSFIAVFFLEVVSFTFSLYFIGKIISLFLEKKYAYYIIPLFASTFTTSIFFVHGGSAEEFCLPLLLFTLYDLLRYLSKKQPITNKRFFIHGVLSGCILLTKFTILGFWFGFMLSIIIIKGYQEKYKEVLYNCLYFLTGMFLPFLIFSIYFLIVGAFKDFIEVYFIFNLFAYPDKMSIGTRIIKMFSLFWEMLSANIVILGLLSFGFLNLFFNKYLFKGKQIKLSISLFFFFGFLGIYFGCKDMLYYFLIFVPFITLGLISIFYFFKDTINSSKPLYTIILVMILITSAVLLGSSKNLEYAKNKKEDLVQYKFAKIIHEKEGKSLLNYGFLDGGFYMAADILPNTKYFELQNAYVPGMDETLKEEISNQKFDFIVVRDSSQIVYHPNIQTIVQYYQLAGIEHDVFEDIEYDYYLYERKEIK